MGQVEIGDPHGNEELHTTQDDNDHEVPIGDVKSQIGGTGLSNNDNEGEDDSELESYDGNKDQVPRDPPGDLQRSKRSRSGYGPLGPLGPVASVFMNFPCQMPNLFSKG